MKNPYVPASWRVLAVAVAVGIAAVKFGFRTLFQPIAVFLSAALIGGGVYSVTRSVAEGTECPEQEEDAE